MKNQWVLVANGSLARIHSRSGVLDPLVALETIECPESRLEDNRLIHEFARELAKRLEEGAVDREYETFWLIASSPLLSEIKACLHRGVDHRLQWTHSADFTGLDVGSLDTRLRELNKPAG